MGGAVFGTGGGWQPHRGATRAVAALALLLLLRFAFVAISTMPVWIAAIAQWNPLSSTVSAARQLFGDPTGAHSWAAEPLTGPQSKRRALG